MSDEVRTAVENVLRDDGGAIIAAGLAREIGKEALDHAQDFKGAIEDAVAVDRQLDAELAELEQRRDLLPTDGHRRLVADAQRDAQEKLTAAHNDAERSYAALETALQNESLPRFAPEREQLARDEAMLALSAGSPLDVVNSASHEAVAALLSPWGRTALRARGVQNIDRELANMRRVAIARTMDEGETTAVRLLREHYRGLGAALGGAGSIVRRR